MRTPVERIRDALHTISIHSDVTASWLGAQAMSAIREALAELEAPQGAPFVVEQRGRVGGIRPSSMQVEPVVIGEPQGAPECHHCDGPPHTFACPNNPAMFQRPGAKGAPGVDLGAGDWTAEVTVRGSGAKGAPQKPEGDAWERARAAYDRFVDLRPSWSGPVTKREREAFIAAMLGTEIDADGYAIDPELP